MFSSQFDGSSQSTHSTDSGLSSAKSREAHGIIPVTVKRISESSHSGDDKSNFVIDGVDATNWTLVPFENSAELVSTTGCVGLCFAMIFLWLLCAGQSLVVLQWPSSEFFQWSIFVLGWF
ncbi:unnamed protein product [Ilex paraguariensis]|uniref:Uncharacterized protein n=1 Tax=Ilex paraguariensis TaxID=185542 RepID=A0ABC8S5E8_9AQUA